MLQGLHIVLRCNDYCPKTIIDSPAYTFYRHSSGPLNYMSQPLSQWDSYYFPLYNSRLHNLSNYPRKSGFQTLPLFDTIANHFIPIVDLRLLIFHFSTYQHRILQSMTCSTNFRITHCSTFDPHRTTHAFIVGSANLTVGTINFRSFLLRITCSDIVIERKTWLSDSCTRTHFNIPDHTLYRHDGSQVHGGGDSIFVISSPFNHFWFSPFDFKLWITVYLKKQ